jgi:hypothetical protein
MHGSTESLIYLNNITLPLCLRGKGADIVHPEDRSCSYAIHQKTVKRKDQE